MYVILALKGFKKRDTRRRMQPLVAMLPQNSTAFSETWPIDSIEGHFVFAGILLSALAVSEIGNICLFVSLCTTKINSITAVVVKALSLCGFCSSVILLVPASLTAIMQTWLLGSSVCVYQEILIQAFDVANKLFLAFLAIERFTISAYQHGMNITRKMLQISVTGICLLSVSVAALRGLLLSNHFYTKGNIYVCLIPGDWFTVCYEILCSIIPCCIVLSFALMAYVKTKATNRSQDNSLNSDVFHVSRPSLHLRGTNNSAYRLVLPHVEVEITANIACFQLFLTMIYMIVTAISLVNLTFMSGDVALMTAYLIAKSTACLIQPFVLNKITMLLKEDFAESVQTRSFHTRTTTSLRISHHQNDGEQDERTSAQVNTPAMQINVRVAADNNDNKKGNLENHPSSVSLVPASIHCGDNNEKSTFAFSNNVRYEDKEARILESRCSETNSEASVDVRIGSVTRRISDSTPSIISGSSIPGNSHSYDFCNDRKPRLKRAVSECYKDEAKMVMSLMDDAMSAIDTHYCIGHGMANKTLQRDDERHLCSSKKISHRFQIESVDNSEASFYLPDVDSPRLTSGNVAASAGNESWADNSHTRTSEIRVEVETEEIRSRIWKKESETGEVVSRFATSGSLTQPRQDQMIQMAPGGMTEVMIDMGCSYPKKKIQSH